MTGEIKSPCISICRVKNSICIGCFKTGKEITEWWDATNQRKIEIEIVIDSATQRKLDFETT